MTSSLSTAPVIAGALPFHYHAALHFRCAPRDGRSLADYADSFLPAYDEACGRQFSPEQHQLNVQAFADMLRVGSSNSLVATPVAAAIAASPAERRAGATALAQQLLDTLAGRYPLLSGETVIKAQLNILDEPFFDCSAGSVIYTRTTNLIDIDFVFPSIQFDRASGLPRVLPQPVRPPPAMPDQQHPALLGSDGVDVLNLVQGVATNLSFALPPPWGPVAAAGLSGLFSVFGSLFGSSGSDLKVVGQMIESAVNELKTYMRDLKIEEVDGDVQAFFTWCSQNLPSSAGGSSDTNNGWSDAVLQHIENDLIPKLENADGFMRGTLANDLAQVSVQTIVKANTWVARASDDALQVLLADLTAQICALKLRVQLHAQLAAANAPDTINGVCKTLVADGKFQTHLLGTYNATAELARLINGNPPAAIDDNEQRLRGLTFDVVSAEIKKNYTTLPIWIALTTLGRIPEISAEFGSNPASFSVSDYAATYGWALAIDRLVLHRQVARLLGLSRVSYYDNRQNNCHFTPGGAGGCHSTGADGYQFTDSIDTSNNYYHDTDRSTSGCCNQNSHETEYTQDVCNHFNTLFDKLTKDLTTLSSSGPSFAGDLATTKKWRDGLASILGELPLAAPVNGATVADNGWSTKPPADSQWNTAIQVAYAFSFLDGNGPSLRSAWGATVMVNGQWKPKLRHLPSSPSKAKTQLQIWRQFVFADSNGDPTKYGLPKIVAMIDNGVSEHVDDDEALKA
ncbi:hypothetical protein [Rhizobium sp. NPDC090279]|uniref:hypothetical protein n=1 Tax=Rhizobium sp. NPDC090279 TaxID=3364499 RepID=UPI00383A00EC